MTKEILDTIFDLIEEYAEARHKQGHSTYNVKTQEAWNKVKEAITAALTPAPTEKDAAAAGNAGPVHPAFQIRRRLYLRFQ